MEKNEQPEGKEDDMREDKEDNAQPEDISAGVPKHLVGEFFEMPDAPPFGVEEEKMHVKRMKEVREDVIKMLPYSIGQKVGLSKRDGEYIVVKKGASMVVTIDGVLFNGSDKFTYIFSHNDKTRGFTRVLPPKIRKTRKYAKAIATYENERHKFISLYFFAVHKIAMSKLKQCQKGMGYDDLCQYGSMALINCVDKWPPFLGAKDKGDRILTSIQVSINNAICRALDDNNRGIKIPSYKIEQVTVRLQSDNILYGKTKKKNTCKGKSCDGCTNMHKKVCCRKKPAKFELSMQELLRKVYEVPEDDHDGLVKAAKNIDNKSLKDFAIETGRYRDVAEAANIDIGCLISIIEPVVSVDMPLNDESEGTISDMIPHEEYDSEHQVFVRESLEEALDQISPRNASILRDHHFSGLSIREIADKYGFSPMRASDLIKKSHNEIKRNSVAMNILNHKVVGR